MWSRGQKRAARSLALIERGAHVPKITLRRLKKEALIDSDGTDVTLTRDGHEMLHCYRGSLMSGDSTQ